MRNMFQKANTWMSIHQNTKYLYIFFQKAIKHFNRQNLIHTIVQYLKKANSLFLNKIKYTEKY